jgi:hypothetical protein
MAAYRYLNDRCREHNIVCCIMMLEHEALGGNVTKQVRAKRMNNERGCGYNCPSILMSLAAV